MTDTPPRQFDNRMLAVLFIAALAAVAPFLLAGGKSNIKWLSSFDEGVAQAKQLKRPMVLYFTADWCPPCKQMKKHVFPDDQVEQALNTLFVPVKIDLTKPGETEQALGTRFDVKGIPTMVITDADGNVIDQRVGGIGAEDLVAWLKQYGE